MDTDFQKESYLYYHVKGVPVKICL